METEEDAYLEERRKISFKDLFIGHQTSERMDEDGRQDDDDISDDDMVDDEEEGPWLSMGMTKEEKIEARKPWELSIIIKLVGKTIGYHYLLRRL